MSLSLFLLPFFSSSTSFGDKEKKAISEADAKAEQANSKIKPINSNSGTSMIVMCKYCDKDTNLNEKGESLCKVNAEKIYFLC